MRLLLAEDERILSDALVEVLTHNNYSVDAVYNGQDAIDYLLAGNYDAAILDIMMPKKDGISVLKELRGAGYATPVIMLTAKSQIEDKIEGLDSGADDYLTKPFAMAELLARVRAISRRQPEFTGNDLKFRDLKLDRADYSLSGPDGEVRLANKEFQMLEMLMSSPKNVISVDAFMDHIWGYDTDTESNVVWVYISYLRKKLTALDANVRIKALRNAGYSLEIIEE